MPNFGNSNVESSSKNLKIETPITPVGTAVSSSKRVLSPSGASIYNTTHEFADTDETDSSIHHTIGKGRLQAASGKDTNDRLTSLEGVDANDRLTSLESAIALLPKSAAGSGTTPTIAAATTTYSTACVFPVGRFVNPPSVVASLNILNSSTATMNTSVADITKDGFNFTVQRSSAAASQGFTWIAREKI